MDLGNTRDLCHARKGDHRSVLQLSDRDHGGRFNTWGWQEMGGTLRQVDLMRQIERVDGRVYLGSIPLLHYTEMLRFRRMEGMDTETWQNFVRSYLSHSSFRKFKGHHGFHSRSIYDWFFDLLEQPKDLTKFYAQRRTAQGLIT